MTGRRVRWTAGRPLLPHAYPGGVSYAGVHSWAIPTTCGDVEGAQNLVARLTSFEVGALDATGGNVPAHVEAFAAVVPVDEVDERRLALTRATIAGGMLTYPPLERVPFVEDAGWQAINEALRGVRTPDEVPARVQQAAEAALSS